MAIDPLEAMVMLAHGVRPPSWIESAPIRTAASVEIAAPPEAVWTVLADHTAWPQWFTLLDRVEVTGAPAGVGGTRRVVIQRLPFDEVFTVWDEPRQMAWAVTGSRLPLLSRMAESVRLEPTDAGAGEAQGLVEFRAVERARRSGRRFGRLPSPAAGRR